MRNFTYHNPTRIHFGRGQIQKLADELPETARVLLLAGRNSIKANGVYDQVKTALGSRPLAEFFGIEPNPDFETLRKAIEAGRQHRAEWILAVGGGSVIDGAKFVAAAIPFAPDPWEIIRCHGESVQYALSLGTVLTLPATGSEANGDAVISRRSHGEKLHFFSRHVFPRFSILDPGTTLSLPVHQIANGVADAFVHVLEQYLTFPAGAPLQDRFAESVLQVIIEEGAKTLASPHDYDARANFMWAATWALNGTLCAGVPEDWATHLIGHELTALCGLDHARTLAAILPSLLEVQREAKREKLLQYGQRVWGITQGTDEARLDTAILATREFLGKLGLPTRLSAYGLTASIGREIAHRLELHGLLPLGERTDLTAAQVEHVIEQAV